jgi:hypothetical protein
VAHAHDKHDALYMAGCVHGFAMCYWMVACMAGCGLAHFPGLRFCPTGFESIALLPQAADLVNAPAPVLLTQHILAQESNP